MLAATGGKMSKRPRRNHSPAFKAKVASAAGRRDGRVRRGAGSGRAAGRRDGAAREDRRADAGERFLASALGKAGLLPSVKR
jgi:transposase-like protein